ncbi:MAG: MtrB/PioB family outer membrane beta-barrel protein, partial [Gemmatimonadetes bacterium]|nr:MtrB/PioB family outer membrane beta-barrel protein [Gemmatimonadota bacterium]
KFKSLQESRNANPFSGVVGAYESWNDPNRNWSLDNEETVKTAGVWVDLIKALPKTDVRFSFNYSDSDNGFTYGGPRIAQFLAPDNVALRSVGDTRACGTGISSCFIPQPNVTNTWTQMKVDIKHMFRPAMGLGLGYQYEKLDITDFATTNLADGSPRMDPLGAITTGYGNRPYTGGTLIARLIYMF